MDGVGRADLYALAAHLALGEVDVGDVVLDRNGSERARLGAFAAADAAGAAGFAGNGALVLVDAGHEDAAVLEAFGAELDDVLRADA